VSCVVLEKTSYLGAPGSLNCVFHLTINKMHNRWNNENENNEIINLS
jgi:hypothetical protein